MLGIGNNWLPFWTEEETEKYVFEDNYLDFFGPECPPIQSSVEDWKKLKSLGRRLKWSRISFSISSTRSL